MQNGFRAIGFKHESGSPFMTDPGREHAVVFAGAKFRLRKPQRSAQTRQLGPHKLEVAGPQKHINRTADVIEIVDIVSRVVLRKQRLHHDLGAGRDIIEIQTQPRNFPLPKRMPI